MMAAATQATAPVSRLHVESVGAGAPLVLLHGFALHGGLFAPILPALARRHRVHVVDLPGHGHSAGVVPTTLEVIADQVADAVGPAADGATVLGWSFGGQVALEWARRRPRDVARLVLVCTTPSFVTRADWTCAMSPETLQRFGDELAVAYRLTLQRFLTLQVQGSDAGRAILATLRARLFERGEPPRDAVAATLRLLLDTDLRAGVAHVEAPALVVAGERDTLAPAAAGRWLAHALPQAQHEEIAGAAHVPFLSHGDAFARIVGGFVDAD
jgi:pimeloyl-[acyl-carrier protein] methyl ester esterase